MTRPRRAAALMLTLGCLGLAACAPAGSEPGSSPSATGPTSPAEDGAVVATFQVHDETFRVELITPELIEHAEALLAGVEISAIPLGTVVRDDAGVNDPWSWHLDPTTVEFAFVTIEVCDGLPSHVEEGVVTSDSYCPWSAVLTALEPAG